MRHHFFILILFCAFFSFKESSIIFQNSSEISVETVGGKANNLYKIQNTVDVPQWCCISTEVYQNFLQQNAITNKISKLNALCKNYEQNKNEILVQCAGIKNAILNGKIGEAEQKEIETATLSLKKSEETLLAVRSSGLNEDSSNFSFAGLYNSRLNLKTTQEILAAIKEVWASSFNPRVIMERCQIGLENTDFKMGVIIQKMIPAKFLGTASTIELNTGFPVIEINISEASDKNENSNIEHYLVHPQNNYIIKYLSNVATKTHKLTSFEITEIAKKLKKLRSLYNRDINTEFILGSDEKIYFVQARPLFSSPQTKLSVVDKADLPNHRLIARGRYSVPGVIIGKLKYIETWEELARADIEAGDILITYKPSNCWKHYMTKFAGLITEYGTFSSHSIILCRERKIPCLIGIDKDFEELLSFAGKKITLDGINQAIYEGEVRLKEALVSDLEKSFAPVEIKKWPSFETTIAEFCNSGQLLEKDGKYWNKTPLYPLQKLFQEINLKRFRHISKLLPRNRHCYVEAKVIDSYVCSRIVPLEEHIRFFNRMTLDECNKFAQKQRKSMQKYLKTAEKFQLDPDKWQEYIDTFIEFRAYMWLGGPFRAYLIREVESQAAALSIPFYYLEECANAIQATVFSEDVNMQQEIKKLASKLKFIARVNDVAVLKKHPSMIFKEIENLARKYRFDKDISFAKEPDLNLIYQRLLLENENADQTAKPLNKIKQDFFPDYPALKRWLYLSIFSRIMQSNANHYQVRGQWQISKELLKLGEYLKTQKKLKKAEDIFNLSSSEIKEELVLLKKSGKNL